MSWDSVPWFVGGGAEHSPEVARLLGYAATGGAEGIVEPSHLRVEPLDVPGGAVRVLPGAALIRNRATSGDLQTYVARLPQADEVEIASTGSSGGRSDLIVARVEDPYMPGEPWQEPEDPAAGPYVFTRVIPNVDPGTTTAPAGESAIALARVDVPASTGTITDAMITDLREVASPRKYRTLRAYQLMQSDSQSLHTGSVIWPDIATSTVRVPEWATLVQVVAQWGTVRGSGEADGIVAVRFEADGNSMETQHSLWKASSEPDSRFTIALGDDRNVPAWMRGRNVTVKMMGTKRSGANVYADGYSSIVLDLEFSEGAG